MIDLPDQTGMLVAVDTETSGLHPDDQLIEGGRARVAVVSIAYEGVAEAYPFDQGTRDKLPQVQGDLFNVDDPNLGEWDWYQLLGWLAQQRLIFHNAKFDLAMLKAGTRHWAGLDLVDQMHWDTMVVQRQLDPLESVGLDAAEQRAWSTTTKKDLDAEVKKAIAHLPRGVPRRHDMIEWHEIADYAANDARLTLALYHYQQERLIEEEALWPAIREELDLTRALYKIENRGLTYDVQQSLEAVSVLRERAEKIKAELPFPATVPGAKKYFFTTLGLIPYKVTEKTQAPMLDDEVQAKMIADNVPWAKEYAEVSDLERAVSMWYGGYVEKVGSDGRIRTNYKQTRVVSGRMSVERVQLQAIPKDDKVLEGIPTVRSLIVASPGMQLWNLDLGQAELRVATKYAGCVQMAEMLAGGADLHGITCREIFGARPGMTGATEHNYKTCHCEECDDFNVKRDIAKRLTFGGIFQIGWKTFQATLARLAGIYLPDVECQQIVERWRRMYPEFGVAYRKAERAARDRGYVKLMGGRYQSFFGERDYPNTAWNRVVQGSLAQFNKLWIIAVERGLDPADGAVVLNVHDSLVLELHKEVGQEVANRESYRAAKMATELFGCEMTCDVKPWTDYAPQSTSAGLAKSVSQQKRQKR